MSIIHQQSYPTTDAWVFTDPHFNHKNLITKGYRPEGYDFKIQNSWYEKVKHEDTIICLGDVCMGKEGESHDVFIRPMPGRKILIRGNHDKQKSAWYLSHGWDEVYDELLLTGDIEGRFQRILLTHIPVANRNTFDMNIHGHFHNDAHRAMKPEMLAIRCAKHLLLAMECVDYQIVSLTDLIAGRVVQEGMFNPSKHSS